MQPSNRTIVGVALLLFGTVLLGVGMHHLVATGTCSSTGYSSNYGPVPYCPKGTGWWILFVVVGIILGVVGGLVSGGPSALLITPAVFAGIGIGSLTILLDATAKSGTKTFAGIFGGAFALFGVVPLLIAGIGALGRVGRSRGSPSTSPGLAPAPAPAFGSTPGASSAFGSSVPEPDAIMGAYAAKPPASAPSAPVSLGTSATIAAPAAAAPGPSGDALDRLAKLAKLREEGALTEDEFNRQKAKLLADM